MKTKVMKAVCSFCDLQQIVTDYNPTDVYECEKCKKYMDVIEERYLY